MNAVFRRLYHNNAFRNSVFRANPSTDWWQEFRGLFLNMSLTGLPVADTQKCVSKWPFYGNKPVNPRQRQDAAEFFRLSLDRTGGQLHQGKTTSFIVRDNFEQVGVESFWTMEFVVKGCQLFAESITSWLQRRMPLKDLMPAKTVNASIRAYLLAS
jgi:hypothetical protein